MHGADVAALRGFAVALRRKQSEIDATRRRLTVAVEGLSWAGDDHGRFVEEWRRLHGPALTTIATDMSNASSQVEMHAARQEHASRPEH